MTCGARSERLSFLLPWYKRVCSHIFITMIMMNIRWNLRCQLLGYCFCSKNPTTMHKYSEALSHYVARFYLDKNLPVIKNLIQLPTESLINDLPLIFDFYLNVNKTHDQRRCQAVERLSGMLAAYISVYNEVLECSRQNLQLQKTGDIHDVLQAVVDRILELKHQLRKLEGCQNQFLSKGAIQHHLTVNDAEFHDVPSRVERDEKTQVLIADAFAAAKEKILQREMELAKEEETLERESADAWWEDGSEKDGDDKSGDMFMRYDEVEELSEDALKIREMAALIQAHEKTRQVTQSNLQRLQKRELWEKELLGALAPPARKELKLRAAQLIQKVTRKYMELKRKKLRECKTNEVLGIRQCGKTSHTERDKADQLKALRIAKFKDLEKNWKMKCDQIKEEFYKKKHDEIREHYRDSIRDWFLDWYDKIGLFHNIPHISKGGSVAVWREEIQPPEEWYEQYKDYIARKQKNKGQSSQEKKLQKQAALMEQKRLKSEEKTKKKLEEQLKRKMMKDPNMHPGYHYPESKNFHKLIEALDHYHDAWDDLDTEESIEVKIGNVKRLDEEKLYAEVKLELATDVDDDMKKELKKLNIALKKDYQNTGKEMPEPMPEKKKKRQKKKKLVKALDSKNVAEKMEYLVENGFLKGYPRTKLEDFIGDHNVAGDDCRCLDKEAMPFAGEIRSLWWERCREVSRGFHRILVVGPEGSGKTTLVHAIASANDAVLFELDPSTLNVDLVTPDYLQNVLNAVALAAYAAQPAIIYIRNVHLIYRKKNRSLGTFPNAELIKRYFIKKLFKRFSKSDNVTIIASCLDPWLTNAKLLKQFPEVLLVPDTSYSAVVQLLNSWIANNRCLPRDLDIHTLAWMMRGYSFSFLKSTLQDFLTSDRIVKMAAYRLSVEEILDYVMQTGVEKPNYEQYSKWYSQKTYWGKREKKQLEEALLFRAAVEKYAEAAKKKKKGIETPVTESEKGIETPSGESGKVMEIPVSKGGKQGTETSVTETG